MERGDRSIRHLWGVQKSGLIIVRGWCRKIYKDKKQARTPLLVKTPSYPLQTKADQLCLTVAKRMCVYFSKPCARCGHIATGWQWWVESSKTSEGGRDAIWLQLCCLVSNKNTLLGCKGSGWIREHRLNICREETVPGKSVCPWPPHSNQFTHEVKKHALVKYWQH